MNNLVRRFTFGFASFSLLLASAEARAQQAVVVVAPPPPPPPVVVVLDRDVPHFRGGISVNGGGEFISNFSIGMVGIDGRLGVQINRIFGIYVQPSFAAGGGTIAGVSGATATLGATALADFTFANRFFVAAGGGAGILNNPFGPEIHFRVGGYPVMGWGEGHVVRKGLMLGVDAHFFFVTSAGQGLSVMQLMAGIGYEAY